MAGLVNVFALSAEAQNSTPVQWAARLAVLQAQLPGWQSYRHSSKCHCAGPVMPTYSSLMLFLQVIIKNAVAYAGMTGDVETTAQVGHHFRWTLKGQPA